MQADTALYAAKAAGRGRHVVFAPALAERGRRQQAIEQGLALALQRGELALHWQPRVDIASWRIVGAEALLRWEKVPPALPAARIGPAEFVAVAERCGLIEALGRFVLQRACTDAATALGGLAVSVNVSPVQLRHTGFVDLVREALRASGLPPGRLELEVTEALFDDTGDGDALVLQRLHALRDLGVRVALDDFGSGPSSLACLRRFPFDTLKIDPAFSTRAAETRDLAVGEEARAIVQTLARLAGTLHMRTVCEGVETPLQLAAISAAGCEEMQGFLAAPPRPLAQFSEMLRRWPPGERPAVFGPLH